MRKYYEKGKTFADLYPEKIKLWDKQQNPEISPEMIAPKSKKIIGWKCTENPDHKWTSPLIRITEGMGCPYCPKKKSEVLPQDSFWAHCPEGAKLWDYKNNNNQLPHEFEPQSNKMVYFIDKFGKSKCKRINSVFACFKSKERRKSEMYEKSIYFLYPELMREWDFEKNKHNPKHLLPNSSRVVWWKDDSGNSYEKMVVYKVKSCERIRKILEKFQGISQKDIKLYQSIMKKKAIRKKIIINKEKKNVF